MLPVLEAISLVHHFPLIGGSTHPILVNVDEGGELAQYVVKIFKTQTLQQYDAVAHEVYGNVLAREFDLLTPDAAFINFGNPFLKSLPTWAKTLLRNRDTRVKFGTRYISPTVPYSPALPYQYFKLYDIETIYAFDAMIFNGDRKINKPNIIFSGTDGYLIDHEQTMEIFTVRYEKAMEGKLIFPKAEHIFYQYLRQRRGKSASYFETFHHYLKAMRPKILTSYAQQLEYFGHGSSNFQLTLDYLSAAKGNAEKFVETIHATLL